MLLQIFIASLFESAVSFSGVLLAILREEKIKKAAHYIVSFAIGALLGVAFLEIIPEALETLSAEFVFPLVLAGIILFFVLEKFLFWYHCHEGKCSVHTFTYLILWGDFLHNFIDGIIIALSFMTSTALGWTTTFAVILHEIPQEIGDFSVLLHGGLDRKKAIFYNFFVSLSTVIGAIITYYFGFFLEPFLPYALALVAGNFIYIATTDLMPDLHETSHLGHSLGHIVLIIFGILIVSGGYGIL